MIFFILTLILSASPSLLADNIKQDHFLENINKKIKKREYKFAKKFLNKRINYEVKSKNIPSDQLATYFSKLIEVSIMLNDYSALDKAIEKLTSHLEVVSSEARPIYFRKIKGLYSGLDILNKHQMYYYLIINFAKKIYKKWPEEIFLYENVPRIIIFQLLIPRKAINYLSNLQPPNNKLHTEVTIQYCAALRKAGAYKLLLKFCKKDTTLNSVHLRNIRLEYLRALARLNLAKEFRSEYQHLKNKFEKIDSQYFARLEIERFIFNAANKNMTIQSFKKTTLWWPKKQKDKKLRRWYSSTKVRVLMILGENSLALKIFEENQKISTSYKLSNDALLQLELIKIALLSKNLKKISEAKTKLKLIQNKLSQVRNKKYNYFIECLKALIDNKPIKFKEASTKLEKMLGKFDPTLMAISGLK